MGPLLFNAAWYSGIVLLKSSSFDEIWDSLLIKTSGTAFMIDGDWLLLVFMYKGVFPGLMYGYCFSVCRFSVTYR